MTPPTGPDHQPQRRQVLINLGDDPARWFRHLAKASRSGASEVWIEFVSGGEVAPHDILSLRNYLLGMPLGVRVVTAAFTSLPPFVCAAWLAGDERRIAKDARIWIPDLPEKLLRDGCNAPLATLPVNRDRLEMTLERPYAPHSETWREAQEESGAADPLSTARWEADFRALADATNEWFPCWEFRGTSLSFNDLVYWRTIRPDWGFEVTSRGNRV